MKLKLHTAFWAAIWVALLAGATGATAGTNQPSALGGPLQKPAWLTDFSLGVKEGYDNNILLVSGNGPMKPQSSWVNTVSPKIGFNFAPLLGKQTVFQALAFGYAPDFVNYAGATEESYTAHRFATTLKGKQEAFSFNLDNGFNYIDGSKLAPTFTPPDNGRSAFATGAPRERRAQYQDRAKIVFQYDQEKWFLRPTASLLYYELLTIQQPTSGYQNWADRYDANGGLDFGFKLKPNLALTLGYRYGHQYQEQYAKVIDASLQSSPSDYQRVLLGFEGKLLKWLTMAVQAGPDFRDYEDTVAGVHVTPIGDPHLLTYYGEASLTADISAKDQALFKYKQWQWVASTGKLPYFDSLYDLSYRHKFNKQLALDLGFRIQASDYTSGNVASSQRDDWQYTPSVGLTYNITSHFTVNAAYAVDLGRNAQDGLGQAAQYRQFDRHLVNLGAILKF